MDPLCSLHYYAPVSVNRFMPYSNVDFRTISHADLRNHQRMLHSLHRGLGTFPRNPENWILCHVHQCPERVLVERFGCVFDRCVPH